VDVSEQIQTVGMNLIEMVGQLDLHGKKHESFREAARQFLESAEVLEEMINDRGGDADGK